jgi:spore coat polysaccharide biosynthesis predicted glycosyltransferase SpsG
LPYRRDADTILLLGPKYALLREGFAVEPSRNVPSRARRVLITLGASDTHNLTPRLVEWTRAECPDVEALVVVGPFFANIAGIEAARPHAMLYDPPDIRAVMLSADIAVSGGGQTTYELAATAAAVLGIQVAHDQRRNLEALSKAGVLISLGEASDPDLEGCYREHLARLVVAGEERARMGQTGRAQVDGHGATRVAATILESA